MDSMQTPMETAPSPDPASSDATNGEFSQGYEFSVSCLPDGSFRVGEPEPLSAPSEAESGESPESQESGDTYPDLEAMLHGVMDVVKTHPMGQTDQQNFDSGYQAEAPSTGALA